MKKLVKYENIEYFMPFLFCNDLFIPVLQKLLENEKNVGEIAALVGYGKASNFAAAFKKRFGVAPREYRASHPNGRDS